jgi:hypothetical protein
MLRVFALSVIFLPALASGNESVSEFAGYLSELSRLEETLRVDPECQALAETTLPSCNRITDNFCTTLWNGKNQGKMKVHDGEIGIGKSPISGVRQYVLQNLKAVAASGPRLPKDLEVATKPILEKMGKLLDAETSANSWTRAVDSLGQDFDYTIADVTEARQKERYPEIFAKPKAKRTPQETIKMDAIAHELSDRVLEAKYAQHPNWQRVERVYAQAKEDILANIEEMKVPHETKSFLRQRISDAKLTLPYTNPAGLGADAACGSSEVNAYFFPGRNELVACAGFFNGYQSDSALYFVIAHELGHSVDPKSQATHDCRTHSPIAKTLNQLQGKKAPAYSCEEWQKIEAGVLKPQEEYNSFREKHPLDKLTGCLKSRQGISKIDSESVLGAADRIAKRNLSWHADRNNLLTLAQPTVTQVDGTIEANPFFLNPVAMDEAANGAIPDGKYISDAGPREIFTQVLSCEEMKVDGAKLNYEAVASTGNRAKAFRSAIEKTLAILKVQKFDQLSYCGENCSELVNEGLGVNAQENFADWIAIRASEKFLRRKTGKIDRREASALTTSLFCEEPSAKNDAPDLALEEKSVSQQQHPDSRIRRISFYSFENARAIGCEVDANAQGFAQCEP